MQPHTPAESDAMARSATDQRELERREVAEHYEHSPEIFSMVLDSDLAYSTGIYLGDEDLETAQRRKFSYIADCLNIQPGEAVFDAGCGWGSVMLNLATRSEGQFHGVTLSTMQAEELRRRARARGVADRIHIEVTHVEDVELEPESLDVVYFVGSIVHMHNRAEIHRRVFRALKPGGRVLISDCFFPGTARGARDSDATKHILYDTLGYCRLLTLSDELALMEEAGLDIVSVEDVTDSYVKTVGHWIDNIRKNRAKIEAIAPGFSRTLQTYMSVGRLSFARRTALEYMITATKGHPKTTIGDRSVVVAP